MAQRFSEPPFPFFFFFLSAKNFRKKVTFHEFIVFFQVVVHEARVNIAGEKADARRLGSSQTYGPTAPCVPSPTAETVPAMSKPGT